MSRGRTEDENELVAVVTRLIARAETVWTAVIHGTSNERKGSRGKRLGGEQDGDRYSRRCG